MLKAMGSYPNRLPPGPSGDSCALACCGACGRWRLTPTTSAKYLADKHNLWIPHFGRMRDVPIEQLDAIAEKLIQQRAARCAGARRGFRFGRHDHDSAGRQSADHYRVAPDSTGCACSTDSKNANRSAAYKCGWLRQERQELTWARI